MQQTDGDSITEKATERVDKPEELILRGNRLIHQRMRYAPEGNDEPECQCIDRAAEEPFEMQGLAQPDVKEREQNAEEAADDQFCPNEIERIHLARLKFPLGSHLRSVHKIRCNGAGQEERKEECWLQILAK